MTHFGGMTYGKQVVSIHTSIQEVTKLDYDEEYNLSVSIHTSIQEVTKDDLTEAKESEVSIHTSIQEVTGRK